MVGRLERGDKEGAWLDVEGMQLALDHPFRIFMNCVVPAGSACGPRSKGNSNFRHGFGHGLCKRQQDPSLRC